MAGMKVQRGGMADPTGPTGILNSSRKGQKAGGKRSGKKSGLQCVAGQKMGKGR